MTTARRRLSNQLIIQWSHDTSGILYDRQHVKK